MYGCGLKMFRLFKSLEQEKCSGWTSKISEQDWGSFCSVAYFSDIFIPFNRKKKKKHLLFNSSKHGYRLIYFNSANNLSFFNEYLQYFSVFNSREILILILNAYTYTHSFLWIAKYLNYLKINLYQRLKQYPFLFIKIVIAECHIAENFRWGSRINFEFKLGRSVTWCPCLKMFTF